MSIPHVHKDEYTLTMGETTITLDTDMVNSPPHYAKSRIECIDAMAAMADGADVSAHASYCWQSVFKYLWRFPYKGKSVEDLEKAEYYLKRLIQEMKKVET